MEHHIPHHIGLILDGNRRWAKERGLPAFEGHRQGAKNLDRILRHAQKRGVRAVTLYCFSSENWNRSPEEVDMLVSLFREYLNKDIAEMRKNKVRLSFIGDRSRFPTDISQKMTELEKETAQFGGYHINFALSYGARDDIVCAVKKIAAEVEKGFVKVDEIDTNMVSRCLSTCHVPNPDLIIRTSGEQRLSNFLLWEAAYTEFYFAPEHWPAFDEKAFDKALKDFAERNRRFGG